MSAKKGKKEMEKNLEKNQENGKSVKEIFGNVLVVDGKTGDENRDFAKKMLEKYAEKFC